MPISSCTCVSAQQDALHGAGRRVHNVFVKGNGGLRCTVCKNEKHKDAKPDAGKKKK